jgi:hypothetical protein
MNKTIKLPSPYDELIDRVCNEDRIYFENHPGVDEYVREYVSGEFWPTAQKCKYVKVVQIKPGIRMRAPYE